MLTPPRTPDAVDFALAVSLAQFLDRGQVFMPVPGDGACLYWSVLVALGQLTPASDFADGVSPIASRPPDSDAASAYEDMMEARAKAHAWVVDPKNQPVEP